MLFWGYIIFSLLTFAMLTMEIIVISKKIINQYKEQIDKDGDTFTIFYAFFKLFLMSFIPFVNVLLFVAILFCGNQIEKELIDSVKDTLNLKD